LFCGVIPVTLASQHLSASFGLALQQFYFVTHTSVYLGKHLVSSKNSLPTENSWLAVL